LNLLSFVLPAPRLFTPLARKTSKRHAAESRPSFQTLIWGVKICTFYVKTIFQKSFLAKFAPNVGLTDCCGEYFDRPDTRIFGKGIAKIRNKELINPSKA